MPYAKSKRPSKKRKMVLYKQPQTLMTQQKVVFRYASEFFTLDPPTGGLTAARVFTANGLADPDITGIGHQPRGFDQLMPLYDHYVVISSKIRFDCQWQNLSGSSTSRKPMIVGVSVNDDAAGYGSNYFDYMESGYTKYQMLGTESNSKAITINHQVNPAQYLGRSKPLSDSQLKGSISTNPVEQVFWNVFAVPLSTLDIDPISCQVLIEYTAILIEPRLPTSS